MILKKHSLINKQVQRNISSKHIKELENLMDMYESRYYGRFLYSIKRPKRLLGQNGLKFLFSSLQRSKFLFIGLINSLNYSNLASSFLTVRSHFETTGSLAYYYNHLQQFYSGKIDSIGMDNTLRRLSLGCKNFPPEERNSSNWIDAINVLTLINVADKLFNNMVKEKKNVFRNCYDFLSEFCHPNLFGLTIGEEFINDPPRVIFQKSPTLKEKDCSAIVSHLVVSSHFFFLVYDKSFSIIKEKEEMPFFYKN